jgi:dTMP kinase
MESEGREFRQRVRQGYLTEARRWPQRIVVIDADRDVDSIQKEVRAIAARHQGNAGDC